jgi:predicted acetyltransferase
MTITLATPSREFLPAYLDALRRGWSPDNMQPEATAAREIEEIKRDADGFVRLKADDREARGGPIRLPDGSEVPRLPSYVRWIWDGEFCGSIGFRWQPGVTDLPLHCPGHIGYAIVPWKRRRGYATRALALMLESARNEGLPYVAVAVDPENAASQRVIVANGGVFIERFRLPPAYPGEGEMLRYRIFLT